MRVRSGCAVFSASVLVLLGVLGWGLVVYNKVLSRQILVEDAWSHVENLYTRRIELVATLVTEVGAARAPVPEKERELANALFAASGMVFSPDLLDDPDRFREFVRAQRELSRALTALLASLDEPKVLPEIGVLRAQIESAERGIARGRVRFDEAVAEYNDAIRRFPGLLLARICAFDRKAVFEIERPPTRS